MLAELLRALRLFGDGRIAIDTLGWVSTGGGGWRALQLPGGPPSGGTLLLTPDQEDELRAFCNLVSRRAFDGGALEWALRRFELACERAGAIEALSDNLLALSALLEDESSPPGLLPKRLAALCAAHDEAPALAARVEQAIALERSLRHGGAHPGAHGEELAREVAEHLRALLRDVICGHLPERLGELADGILAEAEQPPQEPLKEPFARAEPAPGEPVDAEEDTEDAGEQPDYVPLSLEQIFSNAAQSGEILDVFI